MKNQLPFFLIVATLTLAPKVCLASGAIDRQQNNQRSSQPPPNTVTQQQNKQQVFTEKLRQRNLQRNAFYEEVEVDFNQIWRELEINSEVWSQIIDQRPKVVILDHYKSWYSQQEIYINKESSYYADIIDSMARTDSDLLKVPFKDVLRFMAIVEYDYDNGQDRDALARKILGEKRYQENKERLGL